MSVHPDHHVEHSEPGDVFVSLWLGVAVVAMVALVYWLNMA